MTTGEIKTQKIAFLITIQGTYEVDYEDGVETASEAFQHFPEAMGMSRAISQVVDFGDIERIEFLSDDTRNFPEELGGGIMPDQPSPVVCDDCGRTVIAPDGVCPYCGIPVSGR